MTVAAALRATHLDAWRGLPDSEWTALVEHALGHGLPAVAEHVLRTQIELIETHRGPDSPSLDGPRDMLAKIHANKR